MALSFSKSNKQEPYSIRSEFTAYYPYPYYIYPPELYHVTYLNETFPEHHLPFYDARHKLASGLHNFWKDTWPQPKADVYETPKRYYIDVELPGVESKDQIKLRWTNSRTLYLEAEKRSRSFDDATANEPAKPDEKKEPAAQATDSTTPVKIQETGEGSTSTTKSKEHKPKHNVHALVRERDLGKLKRAFYFSVGIDREKMTAKLHHGMLEITLDKMDEDAPAEHHEVAIEHVGAK
ncbi:hypothetical protein, variant [Verruconis gallopava]|uniref:SHSP domain-containing protein n=1 Tax=Verruconis gallopava TaxID=253628 RepID=A0A0D2ABJ5_9PEZI|nr:hypothetical protein, variant [Verruconis gallopava]KIW03920.1 hypothetical protein, variant [Verruconis gallopava]